MRRVRNRFRSEGKWKDPGDIHLTQSPDTGKNTSDRSQAHRNTSSLCVLESNLWLICVSPWLLKAPSPKPVAILTSEDMSLCQVEDDTFSWQIFLFFVFILRAGSLLSGYLSKFRMEYRETEFWGKHRVERRIPGQQCVKVKLIIWEAASWIGIHTKAIQSVKSSRQP